MNCTKKHIELIEKVADHAHKCSNYKELEELIIQNMKEVFNFDVWIALLICWDKKNRAVKEYYEASQFPKLWKFEYLANRYGSIDPILLRNFNNETLGKFQFWHDTYREIEQTENSKLIAKQRRFIQATAKYPVLSHGLSIGYNISEDQCGMIFSLAGKNLGRPPEAQWLMASLAPYIYLALSNMRRVGRKCLLTPQQFNVLKLLQQGYKKPAIAQEMGIKESTVKYHLERVFERLGAQTQAQAVSIGIAKGLLQHD